MRGKFHLEILTGPSRAETPNKAGWGITHFLDLCKYLENGSRYGTVTIND